MSHRVVYDQVAIRFSMSDLQNELYKPNDLYNDFFVLLELGGDNNMSTMNPKTGKHVGSRRWGVVAYGCHTDIIQAVCKISGYCESEAIRFYGERETSPESYIRKARKALGSALSPAEAAMKGFSLTAEITALEASDRASFRDREIAELSSHVAPTHERGKKKWVLKMLSRAKDAALTFVYGRIDSRAAWEMFSVDGPRFN